MANTPNVRFKGYADDWEPRKLFDEVLCVDTGKSKFVSHESGKYEILGSTSVIGYDDSFDYEGDFLLTARVGANAGELYRYSGKVKISDNTVFIQGEQLDFIYYALLNFDIKKLSFGTGQLLVKASELKVQKISMPISHNEREQIGLFFHNLDNLITLHQRKCDEVKQLKKFMLQKMFPKSGELIPEIRFAGFTDDWEQRKLSTIITEKLSNGVINKPGTEDSNVKHINVINMYTPDKIHTEDLASSLYDENTIQKCNVEVGDIFMTRSSLKPEGIAEANVLLDSGRYVFDDHLIRMKVDKSKYDPMFVKINLGNRMIKTQFIMKSKTTAFTTIGQEDILECKGMFPCLEEQKEIGEYFQNIDHLITLHQRKCDELKEVKRFMLQNMFPQKG